jgi:hypothetical protein
MHLVLNLIVRTGDQNKWLQNEKKNIVRSAIAKKGSYQKCSSRLEGTRGNRKRWASRSYSTGPKTHGGVERGLGSTPLVPLDRAWLNYRQDRPI